MKITKTIINFDHAILLGTFEADNIELRINGTVLTALRESLAIETKATMWGLGEGFDLMVSFDIGIAHIKVDYDSDVDVKIEDEWVEKKITRIEAHTGSFYKVMIEDKYQ